MKSKGAIQSFTIALALACLFYMSFSVVTAMVESDAEDYAQSGQSDDPAKIKERKNRYLDSMLNEDVYNIGIASYTYAEARKNKLNLGLDLQGGMHVTLEVAIDKLIKRLSGNPNNEAINKAIKLANQRQKESQDDYVNLFYNAYQEVADGASLFRAFDTPENRDKFDRDADNRDEQVVEFIKEEASQAVTRTQDIIRTRIDEFGVTQPTIRMEGSGRITIELPGVDDAERVRRLLQRSAKLEFWETYDAADLVNKYFVSVNEVLADKLDLEKGKTDSTDEGAKGKANDEFFSQTETPTLEAAEDTSNNDIAANSGDTSKADSNSLLGLNEGETDGLDSAAIDSVNRAKAAAQVPLYQKLQPPVDPQTNQISPGPVAGFASVTDTGKIMEYLNYPEVRAVLPADIEFMWEVKPVEEGSRVYRLIALKSSKGKAPLTGDVISDASQTYNMINGEPEVSMKMNAKGARIWKNLTEANIDKSIAISLDGRIYSYPTVNGVIPNGSSVIQGNFTIEEAKDLSSVLKAGKLPVTVDIVEESTVGPSLGAESINNGLISLAAGFLLVLLFMAFYYGNSGWVANIALLANLFFIVGILASLHAALTLPGMAGIVLTIGMSVDANVLIFERIREELKMGKNLKQAIADGYKNAYSSIIDANVTTLLTGLILLVFGKGPISGFAIILVIGILTSLFSAIFITRLIYSNLLDREKNIKFGSAKTMNAFSNMNWNFIGKRKIAYAVSGIIIAGGIVSLLTRGLNLSVDFEGGRSYIVQYEDATSVESVRNELTAVFGSSPEVKTFGSDSKHKITTKYLIQENEEGVDQKVQDKLEEGLVAATGAEKFVIQSGQKVGPTFARDIKISAIWSIVVGLVFIFVYIIIRFRKWQYGLGALSALFHDVLVVLSIFSIFWNVLPINLEVDQAFIAAILTVVGYSINDTVVVFDRIRESLNFHTKSPLKQTINEALNKTVSRTFITSATTLAVILILFIFGGKIIQGFAFALLVGVLVGTYSSLFIATPIVVDLDKSSDREIE